MIKKLIALLLGIILFYSSCSEAFAITDPGSAPNNKVGIHITSEHDLKEAAALVNTNGGDWGYVTIVITEAERDQARWQNVFDEMRRLHLIPLVRLATKPNGAIWDAPQEAEINNWVAFLNNLNWVTQNRYVIINNEPNHSKEWGGRIDPAGYADYLIEISQKLKSASPDFFILPAGLDPAAANTTITMSSSKFLRQMIASKPDFVENIDGWTSHPYPNASASVYTQELAQIGKKLPVFITEAGWPLDKYSEQKAAENMIDAYKNIWNDPSVVAVTPFILNYPSPPFDVFSWKKADGSFYSYYSEVQKLPKVKGEPAQIESGQIFLALAEPVIINGLDFVGAILARNSGQTIWSKSTISIGSESDDFILTGYSLNNIEPMKLGLIFFKADTTESDGIYTNSLFLTGTKNQKFTNSFSVEAVMVDFGREQINSLISAFTQGVLKLR
jgi:hypothetical protein